MEIINYFEKLKKSYSSAFDITAPHSFNNKKFLGYGYFYNNSRKFVLVKEAKLWEANSFEHILFIREDNLSKETIDNALILMRDYMDPILIRKGNRYPEADHMYSFLTIVILINSNISNNLKEYINNFKFKKNYLFTIRGYAQGRLVIANPNKKFFISNKAGKSLETLYCDLF